MDERRPSLLYHALARTGWRCGRLSAQVSTPVGNDTLKHAVPLLPSNSVHCNLRQYCYSLLAWAGRAGLCSTNPSTTVTTPVGADVELLFHNTELFPFNGTDYSCVSCMLPEPSMLVQPRSTLCRFQSQYKPSFRYLWRSARRLLREELHIGGAFGLHVRSSDVPLRLNRSFLSDQGSLCAPEIAWALAAAPPALQTG